MKRSSLAFAKGLLRECVFPSISITLVRFLSIGCRTGRYFVGNGCRRGPAFFVSAGRFVSRLAVFRLFSYTKCGRNVAAFPLFPIGSARAPFQGRGRVRA